METETRTDPALRLEVLADLPQPRTKAQVRARWPGLRTAGLSPPRSGSQETAHLTHLPEGGRSDTRVTRVPTARCPVLHTMIAFNRTGP